MGGLGPGAVEEGHHLGGDEADRGAGDLRLALGEIVIERAFGASARAMMSLSPVPKYPRLASSEAVAWTIRSAALDFFGKPDSQLTADDRTSMPEPQGR